jgi:DnaJ-class molecular chaperone
MAFITYCVGIVHDQSIMLAEYCPCCLNFGYTKRCDSCDGAGQIRQLNEQAGAPPTIKPMKRCEPCNGRGWVPMYKEELERVGFQILTPVEQKAGTRV